MPVANPNGIRFVQTQHTTNTDKTHGQASSVGVYVATVKNNVDPQNMGRLKVWIQDFGGNPEDEDRWITVSYASPFAGTTSIFEQGSNIAEYADTIKSYGMWFVPPDVDARVLVTFASGRLDLGYWFACLYQTGTTGPVPGLPAGKTHTGNNKTRTNKNRKDTDPDIDLKVEHKLHKQLEKQGLDKDKLRGITTSGAERESPSKVVGILTPGQHQFVMDDGDKEGNSKLIRLRTVGGTQLLLDDTVGHVYVISRDGKNWIEMSVDGRIHIFGEDDVSIHSEKNINMYAGQSINMQAVDSVNIQGANTSMVFDGFGLNTVVTGDMRESVSGEASTKVVGQYIEYAALIHMNGPTPPDAVTPNTYILLPNIKVTKAIMPIVPEHEPWKGHTGSINPNGPGNKQMQKDPAPDKRPEEPAPGEQGLPVQASTEAAQSDPSVQPVPVEKACASEQLKDVIRDENEYRGYPYSDAEGTSAGYGSPIDDDKPSNDETGTNDPELEYTSTPTSEYERLTGKEVKPTVDQAEDAAQFKKKKLEELTAAREETNSKLAQIYKQGDYSDFPATPRLTSDQRLAVINDAKEKGIPTAQALRNAEMFGYGLPPTNEMQIQQQINATGRNNIPGENRYSGYSPERSEQLLSQDISRSEQAVRTTLLNSGVTTVTPRQFDGLVSMHNQLGDVSYAYTDGKKVDLTGMYGRGEWDRAAGFIAVDERDRSRRLREANIMVNGDYGNPRSQTRVVNDGLLKTNELYSRGSLDHQSGSQNSGQIQAAARSWLLGTGQQMPALNFAQRLSIQNSVATPPFVPKWGY